MIAIVNVGRKDGEEKTQYELRINREVIATFEHLRADGLAVCLEEAAKAARKHEEIRLDAYLTRFLDLQAR